MTRKRFFASLLGIAVAPVVANAVPAKIKSIAITSLPTLDALLIPGQFYRGTDGLLRIVMN